MSAKPWYPRYPRDYRAKTMHLNLTERGAYDALLDHYYEIQYPLPADADALYRIAGAFNAAERAAVDRVAREFFTNGDGKLTHTRCDEEIAKMRARSEQQAELARRRWNANEDAKAYPEADTNVDATEMPARGQCDGNAISQSQVQVQPQVQSKSEKTRSKTQSRKSFLPPEFGEHFSPAMQRWLERRGETQVKAHLIHFVGYAKANGKQYADWEQALQNAIRDDWAKVRSTT